jgi:phage FluMu protein gp41
MKEKGTLIIGVEHEGKLHKDFILRAQIVRDSVEAMEDERAQKNDSYFGVYCLAKQIEKLGDIPKEDITPDLVMALTETDFKALMAAKGRLEERLNSFREEGKGVEKTDNNPS